MAEDMRQKLNEAQRKYLAECMKTVIDEAFNGTGVTMSEWMASGNGGNALLNFINAIKPDMPGISDGELSACVQMEAVDAYVAFNERVLLNGAECEPSQKARAAAKAAVPGKLDAIRAEALDAMPAELEKTDHPAQLGRDVRQDSGAEALDSVLAGEIRDNENGNGMGAAGDGRPAQKKKNEAAFEEAMEAMAAANGKPNDGTPGGPNDGQQQQNDAGAGTAANGDQASGSGTPEDAAPAEPGDGSGRPSGKDGEAKQHRESAERTKQMSMLDQMMQEGKIPKERYDQLRIVVDLMEVMREANPTYRALGNTVDFLVSDKSRSMRRLRKDAMAATERHKKLENMLRAEFDSAMMSTAGDLLKRDVLAGEEKKKQNPLSKLRDAIPGRRHGTEPDAAGKNPGAQGPEAKQAPMPKVPVPVHKFITALPVLGAACKDAFHKIKDKIGNAIEENKAKRAKGQGKTHEEAVTEFAEAMAHEPGAAAPAEPGLKKILSNLTDYIDSLQAVKADIAKHAEAPAEQKQPGRAGEQQVTPAEQQPVQAAQAEAQQDFGAEERPEESEYLWDDGFADIPAAPEPEEDEFPAGGVVLTTEYRPGDPAPDPTAAAKAAEELGEMSRSGSQAAEKAAAAVDAATDDMVRRNQEIIEKGLSGLKEPHKQGRRRGSSLDAMNKLTAETDENEAGRSDDGYQK